MNPLIHKLSPIIESFFTIYNIMHDDDSLDFENKKSKNKNYIQNS